jgi:hypothetical protein
MTEVLTEKSVVDEVAMEWNKLENTQTVTVPNNGRFVGRVINIANGDFLAQLHSVALMFDDAVTFTLYAFSDLQSAPIWSQSVTAVANTQTIVTLTDKVLKPLDTSAKGGTFYVGYFQDDLGDVKAIDCNSACWKEYKAISHNSINAAKDGSDFIRYGYSTDYNTYGLNFEISTGKDYTNTIVQKAPEFDTLIGLRMAAKCIEHIASSPRSNQIQRVTNEMIDNWYLELNRAPNNEAGMSGGIYHKIDREVRRLKAVFNSKPKGIIVTSPPCH